MTSLAQQLLARYGVVTRETVTHEAIAGGFSTVYQVLKAMEDSGRVRRGYFVAGLGGAQFAMPAALDLLRSLRDVPDEPRTVVVAATDPANPYGSILKWPETGEAVTSADVNATPVESGRGPTRTVGSIVILVDGAAAAYLKKGERELLLFTPPEEPRRSAVIRQVARMLRSIASVREEGRRGMLIAEVNSAPATAHPAARLFIEQGFLPTAMGLQARVPAGPRARVPFHLGIGGTGIAEIWDGGMAMPNQDPKRVPEQPASESDKRATSSTEREQIEREKARSKDESNPTDPDSPEADVDRDDMIDEP